MLYFIKLLNLTKKKDLGALSLIFKFSIRTYFNSILASGSSKIYVCNCMYYVLWQGSESEFDVRFRRTNT